MSFFTAALIGAGSSILGSVISGSAATHAANTQADATQAAATVQKDIYNTNRNDLAPFRNLGLGAMPGLNSLIPGGLQVPGGSSQTGTAGGGAPPQFDLTQNPDGSYSLPNNNGQTGQTGTAGAPAPNIGPGGDSPFLKNLQNSLPGAPGNALDATMRGFIPGAGQNPQQDLLQSWTRGDKNPIVAGLMGMLSGAATPDASVTALNQFIPGNTYGGPVAGSLEGVNRLLGLDSKTGQMGAGGPDTAGIQNFLEQTPGYQFTKSQGLQATQNGFAAKGLGSSGAAMKGAAQFATGLADQTYETRLNDYLGTYNSQFTNTLNNYNNRFSNQLNTVNTQFANNQNLVNQGFTNTYNANQQQFNNNSDAYKTQVGTMLNLVSGGQNAATQVANMGTTTGTNVGNLLTQGANATASGIVGTANAVAGGVGGAANNLSQSLILSSLMNNNNNALNPTGGAPGTNGYSTGKIPGLYG